ncbi:Dioxygenase [Corynebacterium oculi]|uniref:Dioxygenase n=1 Tax=Corynebacterium oculi TaxID=1544416 RepID=A0A0Q0UBK1_9CORY|nr:Dioxygenase [Corynebacterium oculi]
MSRRKILGSLGLGAGVFALAACAPDSGSSSSTGAASTSTGEAGATSVPAEMKTETAGPYPGDGSNGPDVLDISGVERSDIRSSIGGGATADGVPLTVTMNLIDLSNNNAPYAGAAVYIWHCDAEGRYSMYDDALLEKTYLRGVQVADSKGTVTFQTIVPGCYAGRWPHLHFEVFPDSASITDVNNNVLTSQLVVPEEVATATYADSRYTDSVSNFAAITLETDNVFSDGWEDQVPAVSGSVQGGYTLTIDVAIDPTTEQEMSDAAPMPGEGGPGDGGPGGPGGTPPQGQPPAGSPGADGATPPSGRPPQPPQN